MNVEKKEANNIASDVEVITWLVLCTSAEEIGRYIITNAKAKTKRGCNIFFMAYRLIVRMYFECLCRLSFWALRQYPAQ